MDTLGLRVLVGGRSWRWLLGLLLSLSFFAAVTMRAAASAGEPAPRALDGSPSARQLDVNDLVPAAGRVDGVWYVPRGRGRPQVVVAWQFRDARAVVGWPDRRRYVLTLWNRERVAGGSAHWVPHTLIRASPFPIVGQAVRLADVTGDGHDDLLVTVLCSECNHAVASVSVYATFGNTIRRIYGRGSFSVATGPGHNATVGGREITETAWGEQRGLIWFDAPWGREQPVCCPRFRMQTFLRWTGNGWRTVWRHRTRPGKDRLVARGYPLP